MAKNKNSKVEPDSVYFLKIILFFVLGTIWLANQEGRRTIPVGLILGLMFASHDHFRIDRKIEYAILLIAALVSLFGPVGIYFLV